jgi:hypothetical protein
VRPSALLITTSLVVLACGDDPASSLGDGSPPDGKSAPGRDGDTKGETITCGPAEVDRLARCLDEGRSPRACLDAGARPACDVDADGLDDALEDAMLRSYAPVFAYNRGDGDHTAGDSERAYPTNVEHYVSHSTLYWRVDGDDGTKNVVAEKPTLETLATATFDAGGSVRRASDPELGQGPNFWLCLDRSGGAYDGEALVETMEASRKLAKGVDLLGVAHPSGAAKDGDVVVLSYMLYYAYNAFTLDDHEGDFEGGAVFVSLGTGKVVAVFTDRHPTSDGFKLIPTEGADALPAKDPSAEEPHYNVCSDTSSGRSSGVRYWDLDGAKHHPVIYVAGGGHASYAYPGATKIKGVGCLEATMIRDVHNGQGPKLVPSEGAYYTGWKDGKQPITTGVHIRNLGEPGHLREAWSAFAGQWGCTLATIPKSYPGPWDNERLCRHWLTHDWGSAAPFTSPTAKSCVE